MVLLLWMLNENVKTENNLGGDNKKIPEILPRDLTSFPSVNFLMSLNGGIVLCACVCLFFSIQFNTAKRQFLGG